MQTLRDGWRSSNLFRIEGGIGDFAFTGSSQKVDDRVRQVPKVLCAEGGVFDFISRKMQNNYHKAHCVKITQAISS